MNDQMTMFDMPGKPFAGMRKSGNPFFSSSTDEYATPQWLFDQLDAEFHFTLDPCSTDENAKCRKHYTRAQDGLKQDWSGETVWCNPPYGRGIADWIRKCYLHATGGGTAVMLVPARTDTEWFHEYIYGKAEVRFLRGRVKFGGRKWNAPFPSMIVIYDKRRNQTMPDFNITTDKHGKRHFYVDGQELRGITAVDIHMRYDEIPVVNLEMLVNPKELTIDGANVTAQQVMDI